MGPQHRQHKDYCTIVIDKDEDEGILRMCNDNRPQPVKCLVTFKIICTKCSDFNSKECLNNHKFTMFIKRAIIYWLWST